MTVQVCQYERFTRSILQAKLVEELEVDELLDDYDGDFIQIMEDEYEYN